MIMKRTLSFILALVLLLGLMPQVTLTALAAEESTEFDIENRQQIDLTKSSVEEQIRAFAKSINKSGADDSAATALAKHGLTGGGKKLSVGKTHALTATLWNSEMMQVAVTESCAAAIAYMQILDMTSLPYLRCMGIWGGTESYYSAIVQSSAGITFDQRVFHVVPSTVFSQTRNSYDSALDWMVGTVAFDISFQFKKTTKDETTYTVKCVVKDRFDFDTSQGSGFDKLISGLGALLFREFDWESTVTFDLTVPYFCTHSSGKYHWSYDAENHQMVADSADGYTANQTTRHEFPVSNGTIQYYYELEETVRLYHDKPWVLEYTVRNPGNVVFAPLQNTKNTHVYLQNYGTASLYAVKLQHLELSEKEVENLGLSGVAQYRTHYYGTAMNSLFDFSSKQTYTMRLKNVLNADGTNMVWLTVYNVDLQQEVLNVPMDDYYIHESWIGETVLKSAGNNGISGMDFLINYIGNTSLRFKADYFDLRIWENGIDGGDGDYFTDKVTKPTCAAQGYTTHTCSCCGYSYKDSYTSKTAHKFGAWKQTTAPTCAAEGVETRTCTVCGAAETRTILAIGHAYKSVVTPPTCIERGYTTYTCSACGDSYVADYTAALGHTAGSAADCTNPQVCTVCGAELNPALDHSYNAVVTAPTCTEQGYTTYTCACGDSYVGDYTDELGHLNATAETLADGESLVLTELNVIKHNKTLIFSANVENLGDGLIRISHGYNAYTGNHIEITADKILVYSTNTSTSVKEYSHGLDISGDVYVRLDAPRSKVNITIITASGTYKKTVAWNGCNGDISCTAEGTTLQNVELRWFATGIQSDYWFFGDSWFNTTSSARWTSYLLDDGYTDVLLGGYSGMGSSAGLTQFRELLTLDAPKYAIWALGMNNGDRNRVINTSWLTCTEEFLRLCEQYGVTPILCTIPTTPKVNNRLKNEWIKNSGYRYIDFDLALVENYATGEWFEGTAASDLNHPTELGAQMLYPQVFADFPELASGDPATCSHKLYLLDARAGDCYRDGRQSYYVCSLCGGAFKDTEAKTATTTAEMRLSTSHSYNAVVTAPDCVNGGYTTYTCTACGDSYVADYTDALGHTAGADADCTNPQVCTVCGVVLNAALGHSYDSVVTAPDCVKGGYTTYSCSACGDSYVADHTDSLGHTAGADADCTNAQVCTVCGVVLNAALGHSYDSVVTAPDCVNGGYTTYTCSACGDSYVADYTAALGHTAGAEADCTNAQVCTVCGVVLNAALGHSYDAEVTAPDCVNGGYTTYTCTACGDTYVADYTAALGHTAGADADCENAQICTICGVVLNPALGHSYNAVVTAPDCVNGGYTTYTCSACGDSYVADHTDATDHVYDHDNDTTCNGCGAVRQIAAQILGGGETSVSEDVNGLAFLFIADVSGAQTENGCEYVANSALVTPFVDGASYKLVRMGAEVSNGVQTIDIPAKYLWDVAEDQCSFAVRIINIPDNQLDCVITARPYYVYEVDGEKIVVYGDAVSSTWNDTKIGDNGTDGLEYDLLSDGTYAVVGVDNTKNLSEIVIPKSVDGIPVTKIASNAFRGNKDIKKGLLPIL